MVVGKIWDSEYPWDVRVEKVGDALTAAGHTVHLVCRNRSRQPERDEYRGMLIHRMRPLERLPERFDRATSFPAFVNPRWFRLAYDTFRAERADVILVRDLPLAPLALAVGRRLGTPVVLDLAEHYPGLLRDLYNAHDFRLRNLLVRNPLFAEAVEHWTLPRMDAVLVVVDEMAERLAGLGVPRQRIALVSNTPSRDRLSLADATARAPGGGPLRLVYLGKVETSRGLSVVIEALPRLAAAGVPATLDVYGDGYSLERHRAEVRSRGLEQQVTFHGHQPYREVLERLPGFDGGLIPHHATDHWNYTIQNKLFDYMAAGIPVVVSSMPPAARIVRGSGAGVVFRDRDAADCARALERLADAGARRRMGQAGRTAVAETYCWERDAERLVAAVERAAAAGRP